MPVSSAGRASSRLRRAALVFALLVPASSLPACGTSDEATVPTGVSVPAAAGGASPGTSAGGDPARRPCTGPATATSDGGVGPVTDHANPSLPVTFEDARGKDVTITDTSRILALDMSGSLATTVYALGFGDRIVGRDVSTGVPELQDRPLVTHNGHELNGEAILDLDPSVVLTDYGIGPLEVQLQIEDSGIPVVIMPQFPGRDSIAPQIHAVADALGVSDLGNQLADRVAGEVAAAEERVRAMAPAADAQRLRMAFLYMRGTSGVYSWFGKGTGADELIRALGGVDVAGEVGVVSSRPLNAEGLVKADPDMFLMMTHGLESVGGVQGLQEVPGIAGTTAGMHNCVVDMIDHQILSFGPMYAKTLEALAEAVYGRASPGSGGAA